MAILPSIPGIQVTINVNGAAAREYEAPEDTTCAVAIKDFDLTPNRNHNAPYVVKYIEAIPGAPYEFQIVKRQRFRGRSHHIAAKLVVDGQESGLAHEEQGTRKKNQRWEFESNGITSGGSATGYQIYTFEFAPLNIGMFSV